MVDSNQQVRAPFACDPARGRGRLLDEPASPTRTEYQRDRDRIIHSTAFRRLQYKTQVFIYHEGDHFRTRLTHTLEVSQLARALARSLRVDEDLAEAIALAHDLGHPPFGHAGERALNRSMAPYNGFDHNAQSLRAVTRLEHRYAGFDGLNLTWEALEGIVKHNGPLLDRAGRTTGVPLPVLEYCKLQDLELSRYAGLEAQTAAIADDIAYNSHDVDDGLRAELFTIAELEASVPFVAHIIGNVRARYPDLAMTRVIHETTRRVITLMVEDALGESRRRLDAIGPTGIDDIRDADTQVVAFSETMFAGLRDLREFLFTRMYRHPRVIAVMAEAEESVARIFAELLAHPVRMPAEWAHAGETTDMARRARLVADYIAGMTDRFAMAEHERLFDEALDLR